MTTSRVVSGLRFAVLECCRPNRQSMSRSTRRLIQDVHSEYLNDPKCPKLADFLSSFRVDEALAAGLVPLLQRVARPFADLPLAALGSDEIVQDTHVLLMLLSTAIKEAILDAHSFGMAPAAERFLTAVITAKPCAALVNVMDSKSSSNSTLYDTPQRIGGPRSSSQQNAMTCGELATYSAFFMLNGADHSDLIAAALSNDPAAAELLPPACALTLKQFARNTHTPCTTTIALSACYYLLSNKGSTPYSQRDSFVNKPLVVRVLLCGISQLCLLDPLRTAHAELEISWLEKLQEDGRSESSSSTETRRALAAFPLSSRDISRQTPSAAQMQRADLARPDMNLVDDALSVACKLLMILFQLLNAAEQQRAFPLQTLPAAQQTRHFNTSPQLP